MNSKTLLMMGLTLIAIMGIGCSNGSTNPITPVTETGLNAAAVQTGSILWGYYECKLDVENESIAATPVRDVMFTTNVTSFLNDSPLGLGFNVNEVNMGPGSIQVDVDVTLTHPFDGMPGYNGFDVKGVMIGDGSDNFPGNPNLTWAEYGTDQYLMNADGYTRWYNPSEFGMPGMFGYTEGNYSTPGYAGSANLNGYRYFADYHEGYGDTVAYLESGGSGVFSSGSSNTRNYQIDFPLMKGTIFNYAVVASWDPEVMGGSNAHAPESPAIRVETIDESYTVNDDTQTVDVDVTYEIDVFGWEHQPSDIIVGLGTPGGTFSLADNGMMTPTEVIGNISTYQAHVMFSYVIGTVDELMSYIELEYENFNFQNEYYVGNETGDDPIKAEFKPEQVPVVEQGCDEDCVGVKILDFNTDPEGNDAFNPVLLVEGLYVFTVRVTSCDDGENSTLRIIIQKAGDAEKYNQVIPVAKYRAEDAMVVTYTGIIQVLDAELGVYDITAIAGCGCEDTMPAYQTP